MATKKRKNKKKVVKRIGKLMVATVCAALGSGLVFGDKVYDAVATSYVNRK